MAGLIKLKRTLSIQACFPEAGSTPGSGQGTPPNNILQTTRFCIHETPVDEEAYVVETMLSIEIPPRDSPKVLPLPPSDQHVSLLVADRTNTAIATLPNGFQSEEVAFRPTPASQLTLPRKFLRVSKYILRPLSFISFVCYLSFLPLS